MVLEATRGLKNPASFGDSGMTASGISARYNKVLDIRVAKITSLVKKQQANIFDSITVDADLVPNAILMTYDTVAKKWAEQPNALINVFLLDDGPFDDAGDGALPIPAGSIISVYYSKSAQAYFPLSQPKESIIHVVSAAANANAIQSGEMVVWNGSDWVAIQDVSVIRIGN
jgi:hypothetical protein